MGNLGKTSALLAALVAGALSSHASAASISLSGSGTGAGGTPIAASVTIDLTGSTLTVTLQNTATAAADSNANLLTGVFWSLPSDPGGTLASLTIPAGSSIVPDGADTNIGMFGYDHTTLFGTQNVGVGSAGFTSYDSTVLGPGASTPPNSPDGPAGGLISTAGETGNINGAVVMDTEVWTITGVTPFSLSSISNVLFRYGTADTAEPTFPGNPPPPPVPLPAALWSGLALLSGLGAARKFRSARS